ncbi:S8 family peptidase [Citromicrobium bathyomarinum]|uniref:S8 family peptidase n=1 Tax=Citromicrobium bathyomarinum TaxID=72174 RepID=UPI00315A47AA
MPPSPSPSPTTSVPTTSLDPQQSDQPSAAQQSDATRRSAEDDDEYRANGVAADYVDALYALDNGWDGSGVLVGVLDEGVEETRELEGQISDLSRDFGGVREGGVLTPHPTLGGENSDHGTKVATIIAGHNDGVGTQGFAPGASIVVLRTDVQDRDAGTQNVGGNSHEALRYAGENGVLIVNRSISKAIPTVSNRLMQEAVDDYRKLGGLVINAAGNSGGPNPNDAIDLTAANAEGWLFVVALDPSGPGYELAGYSNRCGIAMDRCVAGVGTSVTTDAAGNVVRFSGTSAATPQVTSLAALILHKWPQLTGVDAGNIILSTARDIGELGVDPVFGHGLIDMRSALSPVEPTLSNGSFATPIATSGLIVPEAFGGAAGEQVANVLSEVTLLDAFGRDYQADLSGLVRLSAPSNRDTVADRLDRAANRRTAAFGLSSAQVRFGFLTEGAMEIASRPRGRITDAEVAMRLGDGGDIVTAAYDGPWRDDAALLGLAPRVDAMGAYMPAGGLRLAYDRPWGDLRIGISAHSGGLRDADAVAMTGWLARDRTVFRLGVLEERGTIFGTATGTGSLRLGDGARTLFAELSSKASIGTWDIEGHGSLGTTRIRLAPDAVLTDAGALSTARFGVDVSREALGGRIRVGLAQPLVVIGGAGSITVGTAYNRTNRSLQFTSRDIDLTGRIAPRIAVGFESAGPRSSASVAVTSEADAGDATLLGSWRLWFR